MLNGINEKRERQKIQRRMMLMIIIHRKSFQKSVSDNFTKERKKIIDLIFMLLLVIHMLLFSLAKCASISIMAGLDGNKPQSRVFLPQIGMRKEHF